jgi:hypothetical protein
MGGRVSRGGAEARRSKRSKSLCLRHSSAPLRETLSSCRKSGAIFLILRRKMSHSCPKCPEPPPPPSRSEKVEQWNSRAVDGEGNGEAKMGHRTTRLPNNNLTVAGWQGKKSRLICAADRHGQTVPAIRQRGIGMVNQECSHLWLTSSVPNATKIVPKAAAGASDIRRARART